MVMSYDKAIECTKEIYVESLNLGLNPLQSVSKTHVEMELIMENSEIEELMVVVQLYKLLLELGEDDDLYRETIQKHYQSRTIESSDLDVVEKIALQRDVNQLLASNK